MIARLRLHISFVISTVEIGDISLSYGIGDGEQRQPELDVVLIYSEHC
jgi:hypothetical protein